MSVICVYVGRLDLRTPLAAAFKPYGINTARGPTGWWEKSCPGSKCLKDTNGDNHVSTLIMRLLGQTQQRAKDLAAKWQICSLWQRNHKAIQIDSIHLLLAANCSTLLLTNDAFQSCPCFILEIAFCHCYFLHCIQIGSMQCNRKCTKQHLCTGRVYVNVVSIVW